MAKAKRPKSPAITPEPGYGSLVSDLSHLLEHARRAAARSVNGILTATYWEVGRRVVEFEQGGKARAGYGEALLQRLSHDLTANLGRGFSKSNLFLMRAFFLGWQICQTPSGKFEARAAAPALPGGEAEGKAATVTPTPTDVLALAAALPLPWSHYVRLLSVASLHAIVPTLGSIGCVRVKIRQWG